MEDVFNLLGLEAIGIKGKERALKKVIGYYYLYELSIYIDQEDLDSEIERINYRLKDSNRELIDVKTFDKAGHTLIKVIPDRDPFVWHEFGDAVTFMVFELQYNDKVYNLSGYPLIHQFSCCKKEDVIRLRNKIDNGSLYKVSMTLDRQIERLNTIIQDHYCDPHEWYEAWRKDPKTKNHNNDKAGFKEYLQNLDPEYFTFNLDNLLRKTPERFGFKFR